MFPLLSALGIPAEELPAGPDQAASCIARMAKTIAQRSAPGALIVRRGTFTPRKAVTHSDSTLRLSRERAIELVIAATRPDDWVVCTTGMASRELFELRERHAEAVAERQAPAAR